MKKVNSGRGSRDGFLRYLRGFYLKILIWFWLAASLLLGVVLISVSITVNPEQSLPQQRELKESLSLYVRFLSAHLGTGHTPARALAAVKGSDTYANDSSLILVSPEGEWLSDAAVDTMSVKVAVTQLLNGHRIGFVVHPSEIIVGPNHLVYQGKAWHVFMVWQNHSLWWKRLMVMGRTYPGLLLLALLSSGFLCFLLVAWLVTPLRRLQSGVKQITDGDLDARLPEKLTQRRDEVGVLCRDFNVMAKRLQALDKSKQRLLRDVSHELRSPLTRLQLALALARSKAGSVASSEHERMERDIDRLNGMIGQILAWSRMSTAANGSAPEVFSFDEVIRELVDNADFEAAMAGHSVLLVRCDTCSFYGVAEWLASAVENIVRNAIRFSPSGKNVELRLLRGSSEVEICIRDYGPGVPEEDLCHLFEPFFRVDETRGGDNSGTGLGMAIAHAAVDNHGGIIMAENANPGLRITIRLPFRETPAESA
ncbi:ATP-binding protein [Sansalvadorimonas sp. 2012CJ34-2]|uniref:histidine kinase n=1 Tax=Parendozoicomonas callyspongiae TaxID=2942213 RepID=A0ABT0PJQ4_9GAMM|nr:ATP-binding protein [Sansalvadorimonas sp. 2012CJ34-2]MCL6271615.1 ATP-binding protein [Sansalvadorimonas sp. 2012CJ34-2]